MTDLDTLDSSNMMDLHNKGYSFETILVDNNTGQILDQIAKPIKLGGSIQFGGKFKISNRLSISYRIFLDLE